MRISEEVGCLQLRRINAEDLRRAILRVRPSAKKELVQRIEMYAREFAER